MLGPITRAGCQEGAHQHVPTPCDMLSRNGFEVPGTGRTWQEFLRPTFAGDLLRQASPGPECLWSLYLDRLPSPGNTCAGLSALPGQCLSFSSEPKLGDRDPLPYLGTPASTYHCPLSTPAHSQTPGWCRLGPAQHCSQPCPCRRGFWRGASSPLHTSVTCPVQDAHPEGSRPSWPPPFTLPLPPPRCTLSSCLSHCPLGGSPGSLGLGSEKGWRLCWGGVGVNG